jgi:hypothetical protein
VTPGDAHPVTSAPARVIACEFVLDEIIGFCITLIEIVANISGVVAAGAVEGTYVTAVGRPAGTKRQPAGGTQVGFALGGLAPTLADAIARRGTAGWVPVAALTFACSIVAAIAIASARETCRETLEHIDSRTTARAAAGTARAVSLGSQDGTHAAVRDNART